MRLDVMATTWTEQKGKPDVHKLAFDERFGMLVDAEWLWRDRRDGNGKDLPFLCTRTAGVPQGAPCDVSPSSAPLLRAHPGAS